MKYLYFSGSKQNYNIMEQQLISTDPIAYEKIPTKIFKDSKEASNAVAHEIADLIKERQRQNRNCILGLATGSSPKTVYAELIRMHREEGLSFKNTRQG